MASSDDSTWVQVLPVDPEGDDPEQVARALALAWGWGSEDNRGLTNAAKLRAEFKSIDPSERHVCKALRDGRVVGFARIRRDPTDAVLWWFAGVCVDPAYQRHGVATALFTSCSQYARRRGAKLIISEAHADNTPALAYHLALGFHDDGGFTAQDGDRKRALSYRLTTEPSTKTQQT